MIDYGRNRGADTLREGFLYSICTGARHWASFGQEHVISREVQRKMKGDMRDGLVIARYSITVDRSGPDFPLAPIRVLEQRSVQQLSFNPEQTHPLLEQGAS